MCMRSVSVQMKAYTQNRTQETLTVQQRFGLGCVSGAVAHAAFYPLEVSETSGRSECSNINLSCPVDIDMVRHIDNTIKKTQKTVEHIDCYRLKMQYVVVTFILMLCFDYWKHIL